MPVGGSEGEAERQGGRVTATGAGRHFARFLAVSPGDEGTRDNRAESSALGPRWPCRLAAAEIAALSSQLATTSVSRWVARSRRPRLVRRRCLCDRPFAFDVGRTFRRPREVFRRPSFAGLLRLALCRAS